MKASLGVRIPSPHRRSKPPQFPFPFVSHSPSVSDPSPSRIQTRSPYLCDCMIKHPLRLLYDFEDSFSARRSILRLDEELKTSIGLSRGDTCVKRIGSPRIVSANRNRALSSLLGISDES
jgi:hypothetical protein